MGGMIGMVVCGFGIAAVLFVYADYARGHWVPGLEWPFLSIFTVLTFVIPIREFRPSWKRRSFWLTIAGLVAVHLFAYSMALMRIAEWRIAWFVIVGAIEIPLIGQVLRMLGYEFRVLPARE
jgi:hypothetical protein